MELDFSMSLPQLNFDMPEQEGIAIVGMSLQIGSAACDEDFWQMLCHGQDMIGEFPEARREEIAPFRERLYGKVPYVQRAYLPQISGFDPEYFRLTPLEAQMMDPDQRLFLESAFACLQNAGRENSIRGSRTGVYVGHSSPDLRYEQLIDMGMGDIDYAAGVKISGNVESMIAARVSYLLDLQGPAMVVNTACSSSLTALHLACEAIRSGQIDGALVGAIKTYLIPAPMGEGTGGVQIAASSGRTKTFDAKADGTGGGEGVIALLLRPLSLALADGDPIRAVIRGSRLNQDGASMGITAPNPDAQARLLRECWRDSGVEPEDISYLEAHGTGTKLGDPIELEAITKAFADYTGHRQFCAIGSVKSNVGHLDCAAGLAGIAKAVLMLERGKIPPTVHFQSPNSEIDFIHSPVYVCDKLEDWNPTQGRFCGVSSFGISGTNAHVVLGEAPPRGEVEDTGKPGLLLISGQTEQCLLENWKRLRAYAQTYRPNLQQLCYTAALGRSHRPWRMALLLRDLEQFLTTEPRLENRPQAGFWFGFSKPVPLTALPENREFSRLGADYVKGAQYPWEELYADCAYDRLPLPAYAFAHKTYWVERTALREAPAGHKLSPCLDESIELGEGSFLFRYQLSTARCWELREHTMEGRHILPGTVYVEMLLEAGKHLFGETPFCLRDVMFLASYACQKDTQAELQIMAKPKENGFALSIRSKKQGQTLWESHAEGLLLPHGETVPHPVSVSALLEEAGTAQTVEKQNNGPIKIGPRWLSLDRLWKTDETMTAHFTLQEQYRSSLRGYEAYPSLLDGAVNAANILNPQMLCLPFSYKKAVFFRPIPASFYSSARAYGENRLQQKLFTYDVTLYTDRGEVIARIEGYTLKKVEKLGDIMREKRYHQLRWEESPLSQGDASHNRLLLLCLPGQAKLPLLEKLSRNAHTICRYWNGSWPHEPLPTGIQHILFCPGYTQTEDENYALYHSLYAFLQQTGSLPKDCRLTLLTTRAAPVVDGGVIPTHTGLLGMGKSLRLEWPQLRAIDADESLTPELLLWELEQSEYCAAWRNGIRYTEKMLPWEPDFAPKELRDEGTYVITGGTGGMGSTFWEAIHRQCPNAHIVLLQRSEPGEELPENVHAYRVDIGDREQTGACFAMIRKELPPIRGVIHTAGIAGGQFIANGTWEDFEKVLLPKIQGAWNLARCTEGMELDFFVLCSSMSCVFGAIGQSGYTAANAFLDGFAYHLRSRGVPAVSVNWSGWKEVGMAMSHGVDHESSPLSFFTPEEGWQVLRTAIASPLPQLLTGAVTGMLTADTLELSAYGKETKNSTPTPSRRISILGKGGMPLTQTEQRVAEVWAETLGIEEVRLHEPFFDAGGSSLLISYLFKKLDEVYPGVIDITGLFVHETVEDIAAYIDDRLIPQEDSPSEELPLEEIGRDVEALVEQVAKGEFSDDELEALLEKLS